MTAVTQWLLLSACLVALVASAVWVAADASRRGRSVVWITFLCLITWPLGPLLWLLVPPPPPLRA